MILLIFRGKHRTKPESIAAHRAPKARPDSASGFKRRKASSSTKKNAANKIKKSVKYCHKGFWKRFVTERTSKIKKIIHSLPQKGVKNNKETTVYKEFKKLAKTAKKCLTNRGYIAII